jgi:hypothetical protein
VHPVQATYIADAERDEDKAEIRVGVHHQGEGPDDRERVATPSAFDPPTHVTHVSRLFRTIDNRSSSISISAMPSDPYVVQIRPLKYHTF